MHSNLLDSHKTKYSFLAKKHNYSFSSKKVKSIADERFFYTYIIAENNIAKRQINFIYKAPIGFPLNQQGVAIYLINLKTNSKVDFKHKDCIAFNHLRTIAEISVADYSHADQLFKQIPSIISGQTWPDIAAHEFQGSEHSGYPKSLRYNEHPLLSLIIDSLNPLHSLGFNITFCEMDLPRYEQHFMGPSLKYNNKTKQALEISVDTRDLDILASLNGMDIKLIKQGIEPKCKEIISIINSLNQ